MPFKFQSPNILMDSPENIIKYESGEFINNASNNMINDYVPIYLYSICLSILS